MLHTSRVNPTKVVIVLHVNLRYKDPEAVQNVVANLKRLEVKYLVTIGEIGEHLITLHTRRR